MRGLRTGTAVLALALTAGCGPRVEQPEETSRSCITWDSEKAEPQVEPCSERKEQ